MHLRGRRLSVVVARVRECRASPATARRVPAPSSRLDAPLGPPLGAGPVAFRQGEARLESGSMLVLYTDGLVETRAGNTDDRIDRAAEIACRWTGEIDDLPAALVSELCPSGSSDDVAILVARVRPVGALPDRRRPLVEPDLTGAAFARRFTSETVARWSPAPAPGDLELLVSELVTNAIVHGRPPIRLRLTHLGDEVLVEVDDGSTHTPRRRRPEPKEEHGRGLHIMAMLARRSGVSLAAATARRRGAPCPWYPSLLLAADGRGR